MCSAKHLRLAIQSKFCKLCKKQFQKPLFVLYFIFPTYLHEFFFETFLKQTLSKH